MQAHTIGLRVRADDGLFEGTEYLNVNAVSRRLGIASPNTATVEIEDMMTAQTVLCRLMAVVAAFIEPAASAIQGDTAQIDVSIDKVNFTAGD